MHGMLTFRRVANFLWVGCKSVAVRMWSGAPGLQQIKSPYFPTFLVSVGGGGGGGEGLSVAVTVAITVAKTYGQNLLR